MKRPHRAHELDVGERSAGFGVDRGSDAGDGCEAAGVGLTEWIERVAEAFDVVGAAILVVGFLWSVAIAMRAWRATDGDAAYRIGERPPG